MDRKQFRDLVDKCLEGEASPEEQLRAVDAARASAELRAELLETASFEAALRSAGRDADSFARRMIEALGHADSQDRFARDVRRRIEGMPRDRQARRDRSTGWIWMAAASVLVVAAVLWWVGSKSEVPPQRAPETSHALPIPPPDPSPLRPQLPTAPQLPEGGPKEKQNAPKNEEKEKPVLPVPPPPKPDGDPGPTVPPKPENP